MTRRTRAQSKSDDIAFPIRVKFRVPRGGLGSLLNDLHHWLTCEIGPHRFAIHSAVVIGSDGMALYFRSLEDAKRCVAKFPELEIADLAGGQTKRATGGPDRSGGAVKRNPAGSRSYGP